MPRSLCIYTHIYIHTHIYTYIHTYIYINNRNICIAFTLAFPSLIRVFQGWEPLQHPLYGLEVISLWHRLLQGNDPHELTYNVLK